MMQTCPMKEKGMGMECGKMESCKEMSCKDECKKKMKKCLKKLKLEIKVAIGATAPELNPLQQGIMFHVFKKIVKKMISSKCKEMCKEKCKTECTLKEKCGKKCKKDMKKSIKKALQHLVKEMLVDKKEYILQKMQVVLDAFAKVTGKQIPTGPEMPKKLLKAVAKVMHKIHDRGITIKSCQEKFAEKFWENMGKRKFKKFMKKSKKLAKKIVSYHCGDCEELAKKGITRILAQTLFGAGMAMCMKKMHEGGMGSCGKCPEGKSTCGTEGCSKFGMMKDKKCKKMFKKCMLMCAIKLGTEFLNDNKEIAMTCLKIAKNTAEEYLTNNPPPSNAEKYRRKMVPRMLAAAIKVSAGEKKSEEFYLDFCKRYISGKSFFCKKKCLKKCRKLAKAGLLFEGVKCKCKAKIASSWASVMCCRTNFKEGCPKEVCAEFLKKWFKDFMPAVDEGCKTLQELKEEFKAECQSQCKSEGKEGCKEECKGMCEKLMCKFMSKLLLSYLEMYCQDGKLDKEHFKKMMKEGKEGIKKCMEKYKKKCCSESCAMSGGKK